MGRILLRLVVVAVLGTIAAVMAVPSFAAGSGGCQTDPETGETLFCGGGGGGGGTVQNDGSTVGGGGAGGVAMSKTVVTPIASAEAVVPQAKLSLMAA